MQTDSDIRAITEKLALENAINAVSDEYIWAEENHPRWPTDVVHAVAIMMEEAGEAVQAANDLQFGKEVSSNHLYEELAQTAAMCLRAMVGLSERKVDGQ